MAAKALEPLDVQAGIRRLRNRLDTLDTRGVCPHCS
jgi:hypothetical protein